VLFQHVKISPTHAVNNTGIGPGSCRTDRPYFVIEKRLVIVG